jgi:chaperone protein EcpD
MKNVLCTLGILAAALCALSTAAQASVVVAGTRVVFSAKQGETTVRLTNDNDEPALVEAWVDTGNVNSSPDSANAPFLITPPLFRMDPHKDQSLRILYVQGKQMLPSDRESLFWLKVLEVPPKPSGAQYADKNYLQIALRSRLKLFYRPAGLPGDAAKAPEQLNFKIAATGKNVAVMVHNPTPYYITITQLSLGAGKSPIAGASGMVAPFGELRLPLKGVAIMPAVGSAISFTTINDYGADNTHTGVIAQ